MSDKNDVIEEEQVSRLKLLLLVELNISFLYNNQNTKSEEEAKKTRVFPSLSLSFSPLLPF